MRGANLERLRSLRDFQPSPPRDTSKYRAFKRAILRARPVCEGCNIASSTIVAHKLQPILGGELMNPENVLALCGHCDRDYNRTNPVVRRSSRKR